MKNKIDKINDIFDKYDPIGVQPSVNKYCADEYHRISVRFASEASRFGVKHALDDAIIYIFGDVKYFTKSHDIYENMLDELKHVV